MSLVRRSSITAVITLLAIAIAGAAVLPTAASARSRSQAHYLAAANKGVKQVHKWWSPRMHWYRAVLDQGRVASLWGIVPLFEALNGLQIAQPSNRHRRQLNRFARGAERYLNPNLQPVPGFGPKPGQHNPGKTTWFDDNGWWGLAFLDAYRATGNPRYLYDAEIAQRFISVSGWDTTAGRPGGIWWNTNHSFYAGESLAGGTLLSARLYALTHIQAYLDDALKFIAWGDVWLTDPATGLYARLRKPKTYKTGSTSGAPPTGPGSTSPAAAAAADERALSVNPDEAAKLEASGQPVPAPGEAQLGLQQLPALRALADALRQRPDDPRPPDHLRADRQAVVLSAGGRPGGEDAAGLPALLDGPAVRLLVRPDHARVRTAWTTTATGTGSCSATRGARCTGPATGTASICAPGTGRRRRARNAPKGSVQLHSANAALFAWMAALGR